MKKPSEVVLRALPLVGTFEHSAADLAGAIIVRTCQLGDLWQPVTHQQINDVLQDDLDAGREPFRTISRNPFMRPDFNQLVARGFAEWGPGDPETRTIGFTELGLARLDQPDGKGNSLGPPALPVKRGGA